MGRSKSSENLSLPPACIIVLGCHLGDARSLCHLPSPTPSSRAPGSQRQRGPEWRPRAHFLHAPLHEGSEGPCGLHLGQKQEYRDTYSSQTVPQPMGERTKMLQSIQRWLSGAFPGPDQELVKYSPPSCRSPVVPPCHILPLFFTEYC